MKAIIIEDEQLAAEALQVILKEVAEELEVITILQTIDESVEWFETHEMPDLVFMDIHLADGSSFVIFENVTINCPIIFTTAYDEYALKAFQVNSIDYLLKPINKSEVSRALNKLAQWTASPEENTSLVKQLLHTLKIETPTYKSHFLVPERDKLIPLPVLDIAYIYIEAKLVRAVGFNHRVYTLDQSLDDLMLQLDHTTFFRANRQWIISKAAVQDLSIWFGNKLCVNLKVETPERIVVSKAKSSELKCWLME